MKSSHDMYELARLYHSGEGVTANLPLAKNLYQGAADAGNVDAMVALATLLVHDGDRVAKDVRAAKSLYQRAAYAGNVTAMYNLALLLTNGDVGVPKNAKAAVVLYQRAAHAGHADAMHSLAVLLLEGAPGVPKDESAAADLYERAVNAGSADAMYGRATNLVSEDAEAAKALYQCAVNAGHAGAMYGLAVLLLRGGAGVQKDARAAKALYEQAVDAGHADAMYGLAVLLHVGAVGVQKDALAARDLYERAVHAGNADAMYGLAVLLAAGGDGVPKATRRAEALFEKAVSAGHVEAMNALGNLLANGSDGVPKNALAAKGLFERAVDAGNVPAMRNLAALLAVGDVGIPKSARRAEALFQRAVDNGDVDAMNGLGCLLLHGDVGVERDALRAKELFERAVDAGHVAAMYSLSDLLNTGAVDVPKDVRRAKELYQRAADTASVGATSSHTSAPSALERAFGILLSDLSILDESFLVKHLRAEHVTTASDLVAGHNIVMLSIRAGVITCDNFRTLGGSSWFLQDNLYLPASKLTGENPMLIDAVFQHAENLGIITSGYALKVAREIRTELKKNTEELGKIIEGVAQRVCAVEEQVRSLENRFSALGGNVEQLHAALKKVCFNQKKLTDAVQSLSSNLTQLQKSIRKQNRSMTYAGVARCMLSFIPVVGSAVGNAAYAAADVLQNLSASDLVSAGVDVSKGMVSTLAHVDLSNFQVARYVFSNACIGKLDPSAKSAVTQAISSSGFHNLNALQLALESQVTSNGYADLSTALVDIGSSSWLLPGKQKPGRSSTSSSSSPAPPSPKRARSLEDKARKYFQSLMSTDENGELDIAGAKYEMNQFLERCEGMSQVSDEKLEDMFFEIADEDADHVNEAIFVGMFKAIREEQEKEDEEKQLIAECEERFRKRAGRDMSLSIRMAARVLSKLAKDLIRRGIVHGEETAMTPEHMEEELNRHDADANGTIDKEEFLQAAKGLLG